jgi:hypothetical protein
VQTCTKPPWCAPPLGSLRIDLFYDLSGVVNYEEINLEYQRSMWDLRFSRRWLWRIARFEVFTAVTMKNGVFWVVTPCGSCKNRRFGGSYRLLHQGDKNLWTRNNASSNQQPAHAAHLVFIRSVYRLLVTINVLPSSPIFHTLMKEALSSSETSVPTIATLLNVPRKPHSL